MHHFLQTPFGAHFTSFESFGRLNRSVSPVSAGLGLNVVIVVLVSIFSVHKLRGTVLPVARPAIVGWLRWTPWLALLAFMAKVGASQSARFLAAYYPLLAIALLLQPGMASVVRCRWWQRLVLLLMTATLAFMSYDCGRTYIPSSVFARLQAGPRPGFLKVLDDYYQTRRSVAAYWEFGSRYSTDKAVVGYATICGGLEPGMWWPWGHGRVERILPDDPPEWARLRGIQYVFVDQPYLTETHQTIEQWLEHFHATVLDQMTYTTDPGAPRSHLYFVQLMADTPSATGSLK
jgi:hypothetical protein